MILHVQQREVGDASRLPVTGRQVSVLIGRECVGLEMTCMLTGTVAGVCTCHTM